MIQVYNSQSRKKEPFTPLKEGKVGIYSCGPTVYDYFHIGNARPFIMFDLLRRYLEYRGYEVTLVQNFTDIDDKMIRRANEEGVSVQELGDRFIQEYYKDAKALGIRPATVHPRATEHMPQIIELIQTLVDKGLAYETNGSVYYRTTAFPDYGKLSGQDLEDLDAGARVDVEDEKHDPADFALWKSEKPAEPAWDSPWGKGRPGWHIECSAMSMAYLGDTIDIHSGGKDLLFPHHENEIAQSEGATGHPFVRYWMHNGFLNINSQKMSKSLGNFFTVRDILKEFDADDVRMFMLSAQYRSPLNFSRESIEQARASLGRLRTARQNLAFLLGTAEDKDLSADEQAFVAKVEQLKQDFIECMDDDLNTAGAMGALFDIVYEANISLNADSAKGTIQAAAKLLDELCGVLGLQLLNQEETPEEVQALIDQRAQARQQKDWKQSDALRQQLTDLGYTVEDTPAGQKVTPAAK